MALAAYCCSLCWDPSFGRLSEEHGQEPVIWVPAVRFTLDLVSDGGTVMDITSLCLILTALVGWWWFTVARAAGAFKIRRYHPHHHDAKGQHQH